MNELFPEVTDDKRPGVILAGARGKEGMTQKQLAEKCGIPQSHIFRDGAGQTSHWP